MNIALRIILLVIGAVTLLMSSVLLIFGSNTELLLCLLVAAVCFGSVLIATEKK